MEIVLTKDYQELGKALDVLTVKDGFARNFLIPNGIAVPATAGNMKRVADAKRISEINEKKKLNEARQQARKIEQVPCTIPVKVGEEDRIFGSVTAHEIAEFLQKEGLAIEKSNIKLEEPIKQLGVYTVTVSLYKDVTAQVKVWVVKEEHK
ncbi:MAG: 50S ribosomal protein L9 [Chitinispirillaceae bacterium]|nr:50S ribosomal protein L9 [Chitinispirillaceae bacterium]